MIEETRVNDGSAQRAFFGGLIDYAGLFPPAELDLKTAFHAYQAYRNSADAWMLGRFVCPEAKLDELVRLFAARDGGGVVEHSQQPAPHSSSAAGDRAVHEDQPNGHRADRTVGDIGSSRFQVSALPAIDWNDADGVTRSWTRLAGIVGSSPGIAITALELKVPDAVPLETVLHRVASASPILDAASVFLEPAGTISGIESLVTGLSHGSTAATVRSATGLSHSSSQPLGLKLRCGGVIASAFPEPALVSRAIALCRDHAFPFKATAGLHHPLRHYRAETQLTTWMHGFVNVFAAAVLAHALELDESTIRRIVDEQDPQSFRWEDEGLSWRGHRVSAEQVRALRASLVTSFGSCSFDEPRDELRALGWLS